MENKGSAVVIVVIALLILGLLAVVAINGLGLGQNLFTDKQTAGVGPEVPSDSKLDELNSNSTSDEIVDIETDINETDLDNLDEDLDSITEDINTL